MCRLLPAAGVDDGAAGMLTEELEEGLPLVFGGGDCVVEVGPAEAHAEDVGFPEGELALYVVDDMGGRSGCEGQDGDLGQALAQACYLEIGGAEVVAPL